MSNRIIELPDGTYIKYPDCGYRTLSGYCKKCFVWANPKKQLFNNQDDIKYMECAMVLLGELCPEGYR